MRFATHASPLPALAECQAPGPHTARRDAGGNHIGARGALALDARAFSLQPAGRGPSIVVSAAPRALPFASITGPDSNCSRGYKKDACTKWLFSKMGGGRDVVKMADVRAFAVQQDLPPEYAQPFFEAMSRSAGPNASRTEVTYSVFRNYVNAREVALRKVFNKLDTNRDGRVSRDEMSIGLAHLCITCPNSRCCYKMSLPAEQLRSTVCAATPGRTQPFSSGQPGPNPVQHSVRQPRKGAACSEGFTFCQFRKFFLLLPNDCMIVQYWNKAGDPSCYDLGCTVAFQDTQRKVTPRGAAPGSKSSPWGHLFAGAVAGALSRTATAPLETLRIMAMTGKIQRGRGASGGSVAMLDAAVSLVQQRGLGALYKGNTANVLRSAPQKALDFFAFDAFKTALSTPRGLQAGAGGAAGAGSLRSSSPGGGSGRAGAAEGAVQQPGAGATLAAAGLAGMVSSSLLYPLEVVRTRMSTDTAGVYRGVGHAFQHIARTEGASALYRGLLPSVAAIMPEAAITYGLFDLLKRSYMKARGESTVGVVPSLTAGVAAALTGQLVAYPLETVSRRMQVSLGTKLTPVESFRAILAEAGPAGLFRGVGAASVRVVPMAIVSFGTYEFVRHQYLQVEEHLSLKAAEDEARALPTSELQVSV